MTASASPTRPRHALTTAPVVTPSPVPEPSALPLLLAGLAVLAWLSRRYLAG